MRASLLAVLLLIALVLAVVLLILLAFVLAAILILVLIVAVLHDIHPLSRGYRRYFGPQEQKIYREETKNT